MAILNINTNITGQAGVTPRIVYVDTNDSFDRVTATNYLQPAAQQGFVFNPNDIIALTYGNNVSQFFTLSMSGGNITLEPMAADIDLPVVSNDFAVFDGTAGNLKDAGYSPTNAAKTKVVMADAATVVNNMAKFTDTSGTVGDAGGRIISNTTGVYAGGGTSNAFTATGLTSSARGSAVIRNSTNNVSIVKAIPGTNTLNITFSADPGAGTTVDYIYTTVAMS